MKIYFQDKKNTDYNIKIWCKEKYEALNAKLDQVVKNAFMGFCIWNIMSVSL